MPYDIYLTQNGLSKHLTTIEEEKPINGRKTWNEVNPGYGLTFRDRSGKKATDVGIGNYLNSLGENTNYLTFGQNWDLLRGALGGLSGGYTTGLATGYNDSVVPMLLGALRYETPKRGLSINLRGAPHVKGITPAVLMLNADWKIN